jgi:DNA-directed RNA polymerase subunit M/transcription elongation factor TFIIS
MSEPHNAYSEHVRSFDHAALASLGTYQRLRQALSDLAEEAGDEGVPLDRFLEAVRDMATTTPFSDSGRECCGSEVDAWPHRVERAGERITGTYRCPQCGHTWNCNYNVNSTGL